MPYYVTAEYLNCQVDVEVDDVDSWTVYDFRQKLQKIYNYQFDSFLIGHVLDDKLTQIFEASQPISEVMKVQSHGVLMYYHIPEKLTPKLKAENLLPFDQNHGVSANWVKLCLLISKNFDSLDKGGHERFNLPRVLWVKKRWSLARLHQQVYRHFRQLFINWLTNPMAKDGKTHKCKTVASYYLPVP